MATRTVTGVVKKSNGSAWAGATVRFRLVDDTFRLAPDESYPIIVSEVVTDATGAFTATLISGVDLVYEVTMPDRETFRILVVDGSATTLEFLRGAYNGVPSPGGTLIGPTGPAGITGPAGGPTGAVGRAGPGVVVMTRTFSVSTADGDPGNGVVQLNAATQNTATQAFIDLLNVAGVDQTTLLDSLDDSTNPIKGHLRIEKQSSNTDYLLFALTAVTTATGYRKLVVSFVNGSAASPFANADPLFVTFDRAGDVGQTGPTGPQGLQGVTGPTGAVASAGANTQVMFNDAGALAGDAGMTYNKTTDALTIAGRGTFAGKVEGGQIRSTGNDFAAAGAGVEILYAAPDGKILAYDRSASAYKVMRVDGSSLAFDIAGTTRAALQADGVFDATTGLKVGTGATVLKILSATATWDPPSLASGTDAFTTMTVTGAALGDPCFVGFTTAMTTWMVDAHVSAADTVTVHIRNLTAGTVDLASGTLRAVVFKL